MKESDARKMGYRFTGNYGRDREEVKKDLKEYKSKGYKAVLCTVPDSPLSRGYRGTGYSIYAEPKYFIDKEIKDIKCRLGNIENRKQYETDKYNEKIAEIDNQKQMMETRLKELSKLKQVEQETY